jgi:hypothetical protein
MPHFDLSIGLSPAWSAGLSACHVSQSPCYCYNCTEATDGLMGPSGGSSSQQQSRSVRYRPPHRSKSVRLPYLMQRCRHMAASATPAGAPWPRCT